MCLIRSFSKWLSPYKSSSPTVWTIGRKFKLFPQIKTRFDYTFSCITTTEKQKFSWDFISYSFLFFCSTAVSSWQDCYHLGLFFLLPWHLSIRKENWAKEHKNVLTNLWRVQFEESNWVFVMSHVSHLAIMINLYKDKYDYFIFGTEMLILLWFFPARIQADGGYAFDPEDMEIRIGNVLFNKKTKRTVLLKETEVQICMYGKVINFRKSLNTSI